LELLQKTQIINHLLQYVAEIIFTLDLCVAWSSSRLFFIFNTCQAIINDNANGICYSNIVWQDKKYPYDTK
ncbi:hypothetical protein VU01_12081, partial [Candidatus Electrothrix marina]